ncbi:hypothetical protein ACIRQP_35395 [Streptomyces sp. NPDC102274]|uniref:hypothetical protein n=1 Tax=Streptomyces sp. NPDC102274 TaxID=3366151 RepID=UPI00382CE1B3
MSQHDAEQIPVRTFGGLSPGTRTTTAIRAARRPGGETSCPYRSEPATKPGPDRAGKHLYGVPPGAGRKWSPEDAVAWWTPVRGDWDLVAKKSGPNRLGFVPTLKFFELEGRLPQFMEEFPQAPVDYVADVVKVPAEDLAKYDLSSRLRPSPRLFSLEAHVHPTRPWQVLTGVE